MAKVIIVESLYVTIEKKFKAEGHNIFDLMQTLETQPHKGKLLGTVGGIVIKELKYKSFRFYFLADGHALKFTDAEHLTDLLLTFVRMSDKNHQQKVIEEIRHVLLQLGTDGFA